MVVTGLLVGMFVVSKISAGVMGTIALIKTLIATYNALKASAIVAGVASYFALNPLAGVAAAAIAAGVLVAANRLVSGDNSKGLVMGGGDTGAKGLKAGGTFTESGSLANEFMGAELADNNPFFNYNGQMVRGVIDATGISDAEASFRQQEALLFRMKNPGAFGPVVGPAGNSVQGANITVNVSGAIDAEGTARTIVDTLNNSFYRGTGGAGNLVTP